jgi:Fe2+ transport system protein B
VSLGAVMVFTPEIFILFVVISLLEDSGYSRAPHRSSISRFLKLD